MSAVLWGQHEQLGADSVAAILRLRESSSPTTWGTLYMIRADFDLIKCKLWKSFAIFSVSVAIWAPPQPLLPPSPPFVLSSSNRFSPATHNSLFFLPSSPSLPPPRPLLVQCPVSTGAFEQFEIKANNGQALPGTSRSPYYTEDARVLLRIIGKSLRFSGNQERELAQRNRWCKQQLSAWNCVCVCVFRNILGNSMGMLSKQNCILTALIKAPQAQLNIYFWK